MSNTTDTITVRNGITALEAAVACIDNNLTPEQAWDAGIIDADKDWGWNRAHTLEAVHDRMSAAKRLVANR